MDKGYRVDSDYIILETPLIMNKHTEWFANNYRTGSALTIKGRGKQTYLARLSEDHAKYILNELANLHQNNGSLELIKKISRDISNDELLEYEQIELEHINRMVEKESIDSQVKWNGERKEKEFSNPSTSTMKVPKRNARVAANALRIAGFLCENNKEHKLFLRRGKRANYTEPII